MQSDLRKTIQSVLFFCTGIAIALGAWRYGDHIWLLILLVPLWVGATKRIDGFLLMMGYYLAFAWDAPSTWMRFNAEVNIWSGSALWIAHAAILSLPWIPFLRKKHMQIAIVIPLTILPPFGAFNWGHPMLVSGWFFPGMGFAGLLFTYITMIWFARVSSAQISGKNEWFTVLLILPAIISISASISFVAISEPIKERVGWMPIQTQFGSSQSGLLPHERHIQMAKSAVQGVESGKIALVFPEGVGDIWTDTRQSFWFEIEKSNTVVIVGANISLSESSYLNAAVDARTGKILASARIPMPVGSWKMQGNSAEHRLFASNVKNINNINTSMIFCYEEALIYPLMFDVLSGAESIIAMSNTWSTAGTPAREMQRRSIELQARLYGLPLTRAENI